MKQQHDEGSVLPLVALCMVGLVVIVALVVDFGATRSLRRDSRTAADPGATAGAVAIGTPGASMCKDAAHLHVPGSWHHPSCDNRLFMCGLGIGVGMHEHDGKANLERARRWCVRSSDESSP